MSWGPEIAKRGTYDPRKRGYNGPYLIDEYCEAYDEDEQPEHPVNKDRTPCQQRQNTL